jgi:NADPH-dependent 2,4-dienoyl-CoA reductase/sulfur reductase-like enzyme/Fe-S-cluster-containing hydrogenase component 2
MLSAALFANGVHIFGHHHKDHSPQGIFCANGQCSQCLVIADGLPVKACMTPLSAGMDVRSVEGKPELPADDAPVSTAKTPVTETDVLIIGGGPAGLAAAVELGRAGARTILVDDKDRLGGKLVLQTHKFFGSVEDSYAGTRGFEIGDILADQVRELDSVQVWLNTTAVAVFSDHIVGVVRENAYRMIRPRKLLVAAGAREKMLAFPGNTLPGVYGAGAFQTLVNRDLIRSSRRVLIVGGGNVGLIGGYHALQAGIEVAALIEALPQVGGYKVHADKLMRLGVPIYTRHTVVAAHGRDRVEAVTIAALDENWKIVSGTEKRFEVDTLLIAVGLAEVNEFYHKARQWGMDVYAAGDAQEIAEASAAMFSGRIAGFRIARALDLTQGEVPAQWERKVAVLKSRPGQPTQRPSPAEAQGVLPVFHCYQEVPCNPCTSVCPIGAIHTERGDITGLPYRDASLECSGCLNCVAVCPGLAITLVDYRKDAENPTVVLPYEIWRDAVAVGQEVPVTDNEGAILGHYPVVKVRVKKKYPKTLLVHVTMDRESAKLAAGIRVQEPVSDYAEIEGKHPLPDEAVICRCERVTAGEIRAAIRGGVRDLNHLKALTRSGMGSCGSKTCRPLIMRIFAEEGIPAAEVTDRVDRPLFVEVPLGFFAGATKGGRHA